MYLTTIFLPFFSFLLLALFGRILGRKGSGIISVGSLFVSCVLSIIVFYEVIFMDSLCCVYVKPWVESLNVDVSFIFFFDALTVVMVFLVLLVSSLVHLYSLEYMKSDPHIIRFLSYLSLFTFFMLLLVTSSNFLQMFFGWEGVGIASYLLIGFWFTREQAAKSSLKAILVNRVGDVGFLIVIMSVFSFFGTFNFFVIFPLVPLLSSETFFISVFNLYELEVSKITFISFFLVIAACAKSAQIGLHTWLPDAMEGPTPVSALIHAATMVTAGVFVLLRCSIFLEYSSSFILTLIIILGSLTAFFAATIGVFQNDLKKIIAYSTCSQLGYMFICCGMSLYNISLFHLFNHGFFKALLFLSAGSIIHSLGGEQDIRRMGGLARMLPFSYIMILIGSLALSGFPFLAGFYSKDLILETAGLCLDSNFSFAFIMGSLAAFFTAFYSFRLIFFVFFDEIKMSKYSASKLHESSFSITFALCVLSVFAIFCGFFFSDLFSGLGNTVFQSQSSLYTSFDRVFFVENELLLGFFLKMIPLIFSFFGAFFAIIFNIYYSKSLVGLKRKYFFIFSFFSKKWYFDYLYNYVLIRGFLILGYEYFFRSLERGLFVSFGPEGLSNFLEQKVVPFFLKFQSGKIADYLYISVFSIFVLLLLFYFFFDFFMSLYVFFIQGSFFVVCVFTFMVLLYEEKNKGKK